MKKIIYLYLIFFAFPSLSQTQIGSGSYSNNFPGTDVAGRNGFPSGTPQLSGSALSKPVPTNDWWSRLVKENHADNLFNYPLTMKTVNEGLIITYIPWGVIGDSSPIVIGLDGLNSEKTTVSDFSDWTVSMNWKTNNSTLTATSGIGMPFVYFEKTPSDIAEIKISSGNATIHDEIIVIENASSGANFVVFGPSGSTWTKNGNTFSSSLDNKAYWSVAMLPQGNYNLLDKANEYKTFAYTFPTDTRVVFDFVESSSIVKSDYIISTEVKEGESGSFLQGLLPHHWNNLSSESSTPNYDTYSTVRGEMKMMKGDHFQTKNTFHGILPTLPYLNQYSEEFNPSDLHQKIALIEDNSLDLWTDSYNEGQLMNRLIQTARIANEMNNFSARDKIINTIQERLEDWLTYESNEVAFLFYYNKDWTSLLGYPAGHGQDSNINDHHFHWGYFIHAAAFVEQFRPGWYEEWGDMINLLIRDAASTDREDPLFPFLRNFSPFAGHSWANGFATFPQGNDQESTSESMQFNSSLIHWGTITGQDDIRDLGIFLYTTEQTSIEEYWFDIREQNFNEQQQYGLVSRVWGNSYDNGTFWTSDITASYGIEFYPIHGGSFYLSHDKSYVEKIWNEIESYTDILNPTSDNPNLWYDTFWKYLAQINPQKAIDLYGKSPNRNLKFGISDAQTYYWLHSLNAIGIVDVSVTSDYPIASVFDKDGEKTYVAHNYSNNPIDVEFSDGFILSVPANQMITNRSKAINGELSAPFSQNYPNNTSHLKLKTENTNLSKVEFYMNGNVIDSIFSQLYEINTPALELGKHEFYAKMYIDESFELSNIVMIDVGEQLPFNSELNLIPGIIESGKYDFFEGGSSQGISYKDFSKGSNGGYRDDEDVDAGISGDEGATVGWIEKGEWLEYTADVAQSGLYTLKFRYSSGNPNGGGPFTLQAQDLIITDSIYVPSTSSSNWDTWKTKEIFNIPLQKGKQILRVNFHGGEFNLGKMIFEYNSPLEYGIPVADAGGNISVLYPETTTSLDASNSYHELNQQISFSWSQIYGPSMIEFQDSLSSTTTVSNLREGVYKIKLKVTDGEYFDYDEVFIVVNETGNSLPSIKLDKPGNGSYYKEGDDVLLKASASDLDGSVQRVNFYNNDTLIYQDTNEPFEFSFENLTVGTYNIYAEAIDDKEGKSISSTSTVYVQSVQDCYYIESEATQGSFSQGYRVGFETVGKNVTVTFELLDTDKNGLVAYLWRENPFQETQISQISGNIFGKTFYDLEQGTQLSYACKFAFAGGLAVTKFFQYTVGEDCIEIMDTDNDGIGDDTDNCVDVPNINQLDTDGDGIGDVCDTDNDGDGVLDTEDNCPLTANVDQLDTDGDGTGDVCDTDDDGDGIEDSQDNCPLTANTDQADWDSDGIGDVCGDPPPLFTENVTFVENIYPNPTDDNLRVTLKPGSEYKDLYFVDLSGKLIKPRSVNRIQEGLEVNVSNLNEGVYILEIVTDKEINKVKVVIER